MIKVHGTPSNPGNQKVITPTNINNRGRKDSVVKVINYLKLLVTRFNRITFRSGLLFRVDYDCLEGIPGNFSGAGYFLR